MPKEGGDGRKTILIVDDSAEICAFYALILGEAGYAVSVANSGSEGLRSAHERRPDLMLVDVVMPEMDGLEMLMHLRSDLAPPIPPAIVCSGFDITEAEAHRLGAVGFLPKPIAPPILLETVRAVLAGGPPEPSLLARSRSAALDARRLTAQTAESMFAALDGERFLGAFNEALDTLRAYFRFDSALVVGLRRDRLTIGAASGDARFGRGMDVDELLPPCRDVVDTGSSLVVANVAGHNCFSHHPSMARELGAFAGVPLKASDGVTMGALCLASRTRNTFEAEDLLILEQLGRRGSQILQAGPAGLLRGSPLLDDAPGIFLPETLRVLMTMELRLARRHRQAFELVVAEMESDVCGRALWNALPPNTDRERMAIGADGPRRVLSFKRASSTARAAGEIQRVVETLGRIGVMRGAGVVSSSGDPMPEVSAEEWLHLAEALLAEALGRNGGEVQRISLRREGWPTSDARPAEVAEGTGPLA